MCGIVAEFNCKNNPREEVDIMLKTIKHRGIEQNIINDLDYSMGVVRLPIIDIENSKQPIEYKEFIIVFNGELYNYKELKEKYLKSVKLKTLGDAEVFLVLWVEYGQQILKEFVGMFGAIIYNKIKKTFVAIRDYLGIKPLYFTKDGETYYFSSEYKSFNYIKNYSGNVKQVLPAHYFNGKEQIKYENISFDIDIKSENKIINNIYKLIDNAVKRRITDANIGVLLSGGIDSSIISYHTLKTIDVPLYTVGFKDCEDIEYAKMVAKFLKCKQHKIYFLQNDEIVNVIDEIIWHTENYNKYTIINSIPAYFAMKMAKNDDIKVLLCGEGSDELFAGYDFLYNYYTYEQLEENIKNALLQIHRTECIRLDRIAMLHTIEGRAPFLDKDLVKYVITIQKDLKYKDNIEKYILRKTYEKILPKEIVYRKKNNFYRSTGVESVISNWANEKITDERFYELKEKYLEWKIRSKEELIFFLKWKENFPKLFEKGADYFMQKDTSILNIGIDLKKNI